MISDQIKVNIKKSIKRTRAANLNTVVVLVVCCFIDGLGQKIFNGGSEYRFKKYIENYMPCTFDSLKKRSKLLGRREDFCLDVLWRDIRCGLIHEIDPKSRSLILGRGKTITHLNVNDKRKSFLNKDLILSSPRFADDFLNSIEEL